MYGCLSDKLAIIERLPANCYVDMWVDVDSLGKISEENSEHGCHICWPFESYVHSFYRYFQGVIENAELERLAKIYTPAEQEMIRENVYDGLGSRFKCIVHVTEYLKTSVASEGWAILTSGKISVYAPLVRKHGRWFVADETEVTERTLRACLDAASSL